MESSTLCAWTLLLLLVFYTIVKNTSMRFKSLYLPLFFLLFLCFNLSLAQDDSYEDEDDTYVEEEYLSPLNDKSLEGQKLFVEELLDLSGYIVKSIEVYQKLPNNAKVFRVKLDTKNKGGFMFVRWDKKEKENYIANEMIDPGVYYNLKASKEIMRKQTDKGSFGIEDIGLQAVDQDQISKDELEQFRQEFDLQEKEKEVEKLNKENKAAKKKNRKRKN